MDITVNNVNEKDLFSLVTDVFGTDKKNINDYSPLALAYIGDAIYDVVIRTVVVNRVKTNVSNYHKASSNLVKAEAQMNLYNAITPMLSEQEISVYKKGRNANIHSKAKNADISVYRKATGFEALMGYLFLMGRSFSTFTGGLLAVLIVFGIIYLSQSLMPEVVERFQEHQISDCLCFESIHRYRQ